MTDEMQEGMEGFHPNYPVPKSGDADVPPEAGANEPAFGVHVVMMPDGQFAIQATGAPNLGEMQMILSRALKSVEARMTAETLVQIMNPPKSPIITPGQ